MKKFLFRLLLFIVPLVILAASAEIYVRTAHSTFSLKAKNFNTLNQIDILILGSSHSQAGFNPKFMPLKTANVAYGSQDLKLDLALLKKSISLNKKPKLVLLEMSYFRLLRENPKNYWRTGLYEAFYDLDLSEGFSLSKYVLISSNLKFFKDYIIETILFRNSSKKLNRWGFIENNYDGIFSKIKYDSILIKNTASNRLKDEWKAGNAQTIGLNKMYLEEISRICKEESIDLMLVTPPVYSTFSKLFNKSNILLRSQEIQKLKNLNQEIKWFDFEKSKKFKAIHFNNDDHLNSAGAELFTKMIYDSVKSKLPAFSKISYSSEKFSNSLQ
jgi:hypothetical protein